MSKIASIEEVKKAVFDATEDPLMLTMFTWILEFRNRLDEQKERDRAIMFGLAHMMASEGPYSHALEMLRKVYEQQYASPLPNMGEPDPFGDPEMQFDLGALLHMVHTDRLVLGLTMTQALDTALDSFFNEVRAGARLPHRLRYTREQWRDIARGAYAKWQGGE